MFFQNAMGVQTLTVTHGDNTLCGAQPAALQGPGSCRCPRRAQRPAPGQAKPSRPSRDGSCTPRALFACRSPPGLLQPKSALSAR